MDDKTWDPTSKCYQKNASVPKGNQVFSHKGPELLRKGGILHPNSHKFPLSLGCLILPFEAPFSNAYWCVSRREWMGMGVAGMTNSNYGSFSHSLRLAPVRCWRLQHADGVEQGVPCGPQAAAVPRSEMNSGDMATGSPREREGFDGNIIYKSHTLHV